VVKIFNGRFTEENNWEYFISKKREALADGRLKPISSYTAGDGRPSHMEFQTWLGMLGNG
jgi:hypothetical protein